MWILILLPLLSALLGVMFRWFVPKRFGGGSASFVVALISIFSVFITWVIAAVLFTTCFATSQCEAPNSENWFTWMAFANSLTPFEFGAILDPLTVVMVVVVTTVSLCVLIYSLGYMKGDSGYTRYFIYMSFFTASMLGVVVSSNIIQLFIFWELVGISSYFLIGFWAKRASAAKAAKKAFIMTRFGDFGILLAIMYLAGLNTDWLDIHTLYTALEIELITPIAATLLALGFLFGAIGKSAQFPLHTWLPDAMEGPTSVSALIHSATMVAAGVFLVARLFPLFQASDIMPLIALIGAFTALLSASMAIVSTDVKRVLAFSTISQLGYMMLALGVGAYAAAIFHLFTHAFFKAGLFLAAGSLHHASGTFNMKYMGGLRKKLPLTFLGMVICGISLAGIFPLSGFWSKDEILVGAAESSNFVGYLVLVVGILVSGMTAFYMFRAIFMTFLGEYKGGAEQEVHDLQKAGSEIPEGLEHGHLTESPRSMVAPLLFLSALAIFVGILINPPGLHFFATFITESNITPERDSNVDNSYLFFPLSTGGEEALQPSGVFSSEYETKLAGSEPHFNVPIVIISTILALGGISIAALLYIRSNKTFIERFYTFRGVADLLMHRYYFDELYENIIVRRAFYGNIGRFLEAVDTTFLDRINVYMGRFTNLLGYMVTLLHNGKFQTYVLAMVFGLGILVVLVLSWFV